VVSVSNSDKTVGAGWKLARAPKRVVFALHHENRKQLGGCRELVEPRFSWVTWWVQWECQGNDTDGCQLCRGATSNAGTRASAADHQRQVLTQSLHHCQPSPIQHGRAGRNVFAGGMPRLLHSNDADAYLRQPLGQDL
jgi:hypothetical protein